MRASHDVITRRWGDAAGVQGQAPVRRADDHVLTLERGLRLSAADLDRLAERYQLAGAARRIRRDLPRLHRVAERPRRRSSGRARAQGGTP